MQQSQQAKAIEVSVTQLLCSVIEGQNSSSTLGGALHKNNPSFGNLEQTVYLDGASTCTGPAGALFAPGSLHLLNCGSLTGFLLISRYSLS
jgi:hypothetical protein